MVVEQYTKTIHKHDLDHAETYLAFISLLCSVPLTRDTPSHFCNLLLALCAGWRSVALVDFVPDTGAERFIAVSGQQSPRSGQQAKIVVKSVTLLNPILKEETVTQSVIAYSVLHLGQIKKTTKY